MNMQSVMHSLPLVAGVLGKKYGVKVVVGGSSAYTDGTTIHLPSLPAEGTDTQLGLVRGYLDHESAHIRETDFGVLKQLGVTPLKKHIWNILEDWRVENALATRFPGCRSNFNSLITHTFAGKKKLSDDIGTRLLSYILLSVRSWDVAAVAVNRDKVRRGLTGYPLEEIDVVLAESRSNCSSSADCMEYAEKLLAIMVKYSAPEPKESAKSATTPKDAEDNAAASATEPTTPFKPTEGNEAAEPATESTEAAKAVTEALKKLLTASDAELPDDLGRQLAKQLKSTSRSTPGMMVAVEGKKHRDALSANEVTMVKRSSAALHARLHGLLQSSKLKRSMPGRRGRLDPHRLNRVSYSSKVFLRHEEKEGVNTLVHILLDCSGSMRSRMKLATQACYSVALSLSRINGVTLAVTAFPASSANSQPTVAPLLRAGDTLHNKFAVTASGGTPLGETIFWALQQDCLRPEPRKLMIILSDGNPDSATSTIKAIKQGKRLGFEFYGLGIQHDAIKQYLPESSEVINDMNELAPAMFKLLQRSLVGV